ncbi:MAG: T9SS type A sorting domain-containing protein [Saprospiraceae bacterium]|nr:T9SS type A sorting domain-containing protein [Saprospiraceae bacterium]
MKNIFFALYLILSYSNFLFAQEKPGHLVIDKNTPEFIKFIFKENPNVFEVEKAYRDYFAEIPFIKSSYTQYYKRWMYWAQKNMHHDGQVYEKTNEEINLEEVERIQLRKSQGIHSRSPAGNWKFAGPNKTFDTDGLTKVTWQTNIYSMDIALSDSTVLYAGGEDGGVWKTTDHGKNWTLTTSNILHGAFGAVKIHPKNPDTVYAGTSGKIIKTNDGGKNWTTVYSENGLWTNDLAIRTTDGQLIFAATNKGLIKSTDSGKTWTKVFPEECWTIKFRRNNQATIYCVKQNGNSSSFLRSTDGGTFWFTIGNGWYNPGINETVTGALIAVCPSNSNKLYAYLCGNGGTLNGYVGAFVSLNGGDSWNNTNPTNAIGGTYSIPTHTNLMAHNGTNGFNQGFYDMAIIVNPKNENQLIAGGTSWFKSVDGGATWTGLGGYVGSLPWSHPDIQCMVAQGNDLWIGSDGGINYSNDFGQTSEARMDGISGANLWGFDAGWNEDILVGGRYHNGNMAWHESFPATSFYRMGGAEAATGYVNPGPGRKTYFSDIGGYALKSGFTSGVSYFPVGLFPNETYAYYANSQMTWHPQCWNIIYLGRDNKIWKSLDGGGTFQLLYTFPGNVDNKVFEIEISRFNPQIIYTTQWDGTDDSLWKTLDGGKTWNRCTPLPLPNNNDRAKISLSATNPNELWIALTYGSNGKKVYKTIDGGLSWINLTSTKLDNITITDILHQYGTNGGVYLGTSRGVFYKTDGMVDWQAYSDGLPVSAETNRLKPFYRDGKIRNGCWGFGVWENSLFEESKVVAQAMVDKLESFCIRDTFYFDDYSAVNHNGASWTWTIPDTRYLAGDKTRTPKAIFNSQGLKQIVMNLKNATGSFYDTIYVNVKNQCEKDSLPGGALSFSGAGSYAQIPPLGKITNTITMMAWIKSNGNQKDWAGLLFTRNAGTAAGISVLNNGDIRYHWDAGGYNWVSKARLIPGEWTHVAIVASPDAITIYKDGVPFTNTVTVVPQSFESPLIIGADLNGGDRYFKGEMDEICTYDRALSQSEIREIMHLTRTHTNNPGMLSYHQFNEGVDLILDKQNSFHASLSGNVSIINSTAPVGPGFSHRLDIRNKGSFSFGLTGLIIDSEDSGVYPNGELCITRINYIPTIGFNPIQKPVSPAYWILHNFGSNTSFTAFKNMNFQNIGAVSTQTTMDELKLFKRVPNADTSTWLFSDVSVGLQAGNNASAQFNKTKVQTQGQFLITKAISDTLVVGIDKPIAWNENPELAIYPNPLTGDQLFNIETTLEGEVKTKLIDDKGRTIFMFSFHKKYQFDPTHLQAGIYICSFETKQHLIFKKIIIAK